jgi:hypothetical protein
LHRDKFCASSLSPAWLLRYFVVSPSQPLGIVLSGTGAPHDLAAISIYDDELDRVSTAILRRKRLCLRLVSFTSLIAEAEGINGDGGGPLVKAIDSGQLAHHELVNIIAAAPRPDAFDITAGAIENPPDVVPADHFLGRRTAPKGRRTRRSTLGPQKQ